jgi:hypothetical protein
MRGGAVGGVSRKSHCRKFDDAPCALSFLYSHPGFNMVHRIPSKFELPLGSQLQLVRTQKPCALWFSTEFPYQTSRAVGCL